VTALAKPDYSLIGPAGKLAEEQGLVAAEWYHTDIPRKRMKELMRRRDWPAIRDTTIWFALIAASGFGAYWFWGSWACVPFFLLYGVLFSSGSDSRWHEAGHGTAFKTPWLNDALYQVSAFMGMREATLWRWSHARHHTDTLIVGRDREIVAMRPPDALNLVLNIFALRDIVEAPMSVIRHAAGRLTAEEATFVPESEHPKVFREARVWVAIYLAVIALAIAIGSALPLLFVAVPNVYGRWAGWLFAIAQHGGLSENVLDHRLNSRTIYMNPALRFLFMNMNYHLEHHMFPMVPYHALPELHEEVKHDMPAPYKSTIAAFREILPALWRQLREPGYFITRELPASASPFRAELHRAAFETTPRDLAADRP
jgi:fatty acid desaturase